jgi:hypothetical protein
LSCAPHGSLALTCKKKELPVQQPISASQLPPRLPRLPRRCRRRYPRRTTLNRALPAARSPTPAKHVHQGRTQIWLRPRNRREGPMRDVENSSLRRLQHQDRQARREV